MGGQRSSEGVQYFKHFPKSFLRSYGKADSDLRPENSFNRLHSWNCEWLNRPDVAISEFADTILTNLSVLRDNRDILRNPFLHDVEALFNPITSSLEKFNKPTAPQDIAPTTQDVGLVMRALEGTADTEQILQRLFHVGGAMYLLGIHCLIPSFLLWSPEEFSSRVKETKETAVFRAEKDAKAMRDYLLGSILKKPPARKPGSGPRPSSFWEEDVQSPPPSTSRNRRAASVWQEREVDDDNEEEDTDEDDDDYEEQEGDFETREEFHDTPPRDRGKRPASTSTDTSTSAKKKRSAPSNTRGKASTSRGQKSTRGRGRGRRGKHIFFSED